MRSRGLLLLLTLAVLSLGSSSSFAEGRTIQDINVIPTRVLQRAISAKFYQSILVSPIRGWVTVRGHLHGTELDDLRVVRAEPNHANDHLALQRAREVKISGAYTIEHPNTQGSVLVHLLLYDTADGMLALSFAHLDGPGGEQMQYYGCTRMAVLKKDSGTWVDIKAPPGDGGSAVFVRQFTTIAMTMPC